VCVACGEPLPGGSTICSCGEIAFDEPLPSSHHLAPLRKDNPPACEVAAAQATPRDALSEADALLDAFAPPRRGAGGAGGIPQIAAGGWRGGGQSIGPTPRMDGGFISAGAGSLGPTPRMDGGFIAAGAGSLGPTPRMDGGFAKGVLDHLGPTPRMETGVSGNRIGPAPAEDIGGPTPRMETGVSGNRIAPAPAEDIGGPTPRMGEIGRDAAEGTPRMTMAAHVAQQRLRASNAPPAPMLGDYLADQLEAAGGKSVTMQVKGAAVAGATGPVAAGAGQGRALRQAQVRPGRGKFWVHGEDQWHFFLRFWGARAACYSPAQDFMTRSGCEITLW
jgi:hypothetical protein